MITRKIKDIDTLIDSLPSEASTKQLQNAALEKMHTENEKQGDELERQVGEAEKMLEQISAGLEDISNTQLNARRVSFFLCDNPLFWHLYNRQYRVFIYRIYCTMMMRELML